jgi:hypothetical protein
MFRWLNSAKRLPKVIRSVTISDGVEITKATSRSTA